MAAAPLRKAPLTHEIALKTTQFLLPYRDPADYFPGATAHIAGQVLGR